MLVTFIVVYSNLVRGIIFFSFIIINNNNNIVLGVKQI